MGAMAMRTIINPKLAGLMASGADLGQEYNMVNAGKAWTTGDFDLFPAGSGQVSALIKEIKPVKDILQEMAS
jgi:enoyl-[acyl-carrier protein] reductase II